jgi:hypothetical protein
MNANDSATATTAPPAKPAKNAKIEAAKANAKDMLYSLQFKQLRHDEIYHSDICLLRIQARIAHHTLHLSKYAGKMAEAMIAEREVNHVVLTSTVLDAMIIVMSSANALNIPLWEMEAADEDLVGVIQGKQLEGDSKVFAIGYVVAVGKLAKAVEALDHVEFMDSRTSYEQTLKSMWMLLLKFWRTLTPQKLGDALQARMYAIESKNIYYGLHPTYENDYLLSSRE